MSRLTFGLELEFFVKNIETGEIVPAYKHTNQLDGSQVVGELRTSPKEGIVKAVFELERLRYEEEIRLNATGHTMVIEGQHKFNNDELKALQVDTNYRSGKIGAYTAAVETILSVYPGNKTGKVLPKGLYKASLQINVTQMESVSVNIVDNNGKTHYKSRQVAVPFDHPAFIQMLDAHFKEDIKAAKRVKGVYAFKSTYSAAAGRRIEYRSLPNTIDLRDLMKILAKL